MKILFTHDHVFYKNNNLHYSNGGLSYGVLKRYVDVFGGVEVLSRSANAEKTVGLTLASGDGVTFKSIPNFKSLKNVWKYLEAKKIIFKEVENCDFLIARLPSSISVLAVKAAIKYKKPYLIEVVGCAWDANINHGSFVGKILAPYSFLMLKSIVSRSCYTIYITKFFLQKRYPNLNNTKVCPNVQLGSISESILVDRIKKIKKESDVLKIGLIGSLDVNYKGHDVLIKAAKCLVDEGFNLVIEFLGKGNKDNWRKIIEDTNMQEYVMFKGSLTSGKDVYNWIDTLDILVQPSSAEAQGRSIIEGMSRACPIVSTKVGGIVELINSEHLVNKNNYKHLSVKIKNIWMNKDLMISMAIENYEKAKEFSSEKIEHNRTSFLEFFLSKNK